MYHNEWSYIMCGTIIEPNIRTLYGNC